MASQILLCCGSVSPKVTLLPKIFLNFRFNGFDKQSILNLSRYGSIGYTDVVNDNSEITLLGEREDAALCLFILPTPPLRQDMTQGQFLSGV